MWRRLPSTNTPRSVTELVVCVQLHIVTCSLLCLSATSKDVGASLRTPHIILQRAAPVSYKLPDLTVDREKQLQLPPMHLLTPTTAVTLPSLQLPHHRRTALLKTKATLPNTVQAGDNESLKTANDQRYSRQVLALGDTAQKRLQVAKVLVCGLYGAGVETAKNLVLMGVQQVTLCDSSLTAYSDLASNFFLDANDVGFGRATQLLKHLRNLSYRTHVAVCEVPFPTIETLKQHDVVVVVNWRQKDAIAINRMCREIGSMGQKMPLFVYMQTHGVFGFVFNDFGDNFMVEAPTEMRPQTKRVRNVEIGCPTTIYCNPSEGTHSNSCHDLETSDFVVFDGLPGLLADEPQRSHRVTVRSSCSFSIDVNSSSWPPYIKGGTFRKLTIPQTISFKPLEAAWKSPHFASTDAQKLEREAAVHTCFAVLEKYLDMYGVMPHSGHLGDAEAFTNIWRHIWGDSYLQLAATFAKTARGNIAPMASILGGIAAHEVIKGVSHVCNPVQQFIVFDASEALPNPLPSYQSCQPRNSRYDGQIAIFGYEFQKQLSLLSAFLVGAGAIGSELLKNLSLMGVAAHVQNPLAVLLLRIAAITVKFVRLLLSPLLRRKQYTLLTHVIDSLNPLLFSSRLYLTDFDYIEESNLPRQLLFTTSDIKKSKSRVAAKIIKQKNPSMQITAFTKAVDENSENTFDDKFWEGLDVIFNGLDNVASRLYVDARCLFYGKPLLESGTLGGKGNTQVILPHLTETYGSNEEAVEVDIPVCTIKGFPYEIEHTVEWAMEVFDELFVKRPEALNKFFDDPEEVLSQYTDQGVERLRIFLDLLINDMVLARPFDFEDCILWGRYKYDELFVKNICTLKDQLPDDEYEEKCTKFGAPRSEPFNLMNPLHTAFLKEAAIHRAEVYGIPTAAASFSLANLSTILTREPSNGPTRKQGLIRLLNDAVGQRHRHYFERYIEKLGASKNDRVFVALFHLYENLLEINKRISEGMQTATSLRYPMLACTASLDDKQLVVYLIELLDAFLTYRLVEKLYVDGLKDEEEESAQRAFHALSTNLEGTNENGDGTYPTVQLKISPLDLESHSSHSLGFITTISNLRAKNFNIPMATGMETKQLAAKIVPAMATSTAIVSGLCCLELYKAMMLGYCDKRSLGTSAVSGVWKLRRKQEAARRGMKPLNQKAEETAGFGETAPIEHLLPFKNNYFNLGVPFFAMSSPGSAPKAWVNTGRQQGAMYSVWDFIKIEEGDMTLKGFIDKCEEEFGIDVQMISAGDIVVYSKQDYAEMFVALEQSKGCNRLKPLVSLMRNLRMVANKCNNISGNGDKLVPQSQSLMKMKAIMQEAFSKAGRNFPVSDNQKYILLDVTGTSKETEEEIELPLVRYRFKY